MTLESNLTALENSERRAQHQLEGAFELWSDPKSVQFVQRCSDPVLASSKRFRSDIAQLMQEVRAAQAMLDRH